MVTHNRPPLGTTAFRSDSAMSIDRRLLLLGLIGAGGALASGCGGVRSGGAFPEIGFADWSDDEPEYLLYPGDEIEVATPTAPENTKTLRIGPDGRISLPLVGQLMAADRTIAELEADASSAFATQ